MLIRALAATLLLFAVTFTYVTAQEPTPQPTPEWPRCIQGFPAQQGGLTVAAGNGTRFTLPKGSSFQVLVTPPGASRSDICHVESNSIITISHDCEEISRRLGDPAGGPVLDELLASCVPASELECSGTYHGGQTITAVSGIRVTFPPMGQYGIRIPPPGGANDFTICHVGSDSSVVISISPPCQEVRRTLHAPEATAILDEIVRSCRVPPPPTPTPCSGDIAGDQTLAVGAVTIALPPGAYGISTFPTSDYILTLTICTVADGSSVRLSTIDCHENYRQQETAISARVLDQIAQSCAVTGTPPNGIRPPDTGEAGLRTRENE
jgi:hypothetical protein